MPSPFSAQTEAAHPRFPIENGRFWKSLGLLLILCAAAGAAAAWLGRDVSWDFKNYHAYNGYAFDGNRMGWDVFPDSVHVFYNPFWDLFTERIASWLHTSRAVTFALGSFFGVSAFFLIRILSILFPASHDRMGRLAAWAMGVTGMAVVLQLGLTFNEIQQSVLLSAGLFLLLDAARRQGDSRAFGLLALSGFMAGAAVGAKFTAAPMALGMAAGAFAGGGWGRRGLASLAVFGAGAMGGFALTGAFWCWQMLTEYGNPVFPYFNDVFHSPYFAQESMREVRMLPESLFQALFYPFYWCVTNGHVGAASMRDARFALVLGLALIALAWGLARRILRRCPAPVQGETASVRVWAGFWVFMAASYVGWMALFSFYRYLVILEMLTGAAALFFLHQLIPERFKLRTAAMILCAVIAMGSASGGCIRRGPHTGAFFQAQVPPVPEDSLVLIMTHRPGAYLVRFFPPSVRFCTVAPRRLIYQPDQGGGPSIREAPMKTLLLKQARDLIVNHTGPVFVLDSASRCDRLLHERLLSQYGLKKLDRGGREIHSVVDAPGLFLYPTEPDADWTQGPAPDPPGVTVCSRLEAESPGDPDAEVEWWVDMKGRGVVDLFAACRAEDGRIYRIRSKAKSAGFEKDDVFMSGVEVDGERSVLVVRARIQDAPPGRYWVCAAVTPPGLSPPDVDQWGSCLAAF